MASVNIPVNLDSQALTNPQDTKGIVLNAAAKATSCAAAAVGTLFFADMALVSDSPVRAALAVGATVLTGAAIALSKWSRRHEEGNWANKLILDTPPAIIQEVFQPQKPPAQGKPPFSRDKLKAEWARLKAELIQAIAGAKGSSASSDIYFDLGSWASWNFVDWNTNPPTLSQAGLDNWLSGFATQLQAANISQTTVSFAQLNDLANILSGNLGGCSSDDAFYMLSVSTSDATITVDGEQLNILQYMVGYLKAQGILTTLSFGGAVASPSNFIFSGTAQESASQMAQLVAMYGFSGIDFDLETGAEQMVQDNGADYLATFFYTLNQVEKIPSTFTVMGDLGEWGPQGQFFGPIFQQGYPFNEMFSGVNLMLYSDTQYYLDATGNYTWDIVSWLNAFSEQTGGALSPAQCAPYLHIGFNDSIDYLNPASSGGEIYTFPPNVTTSGAAAANILAQLQANVSTALGEPVTFGASFFWPGEGNYNVNPPQDPCLFLTNDPFEADFSQGQATFKRALRPQKVGR